MKKLIDYYVWAGELVTRLKYPPIESVLNMKSFFAKAIIDFWLFSIGALIYFIYNLIFYREALDFIFLSVFLLVYLCMFLQWIVLEFVWCFLVWNPRAKKLTANN